MSERYYPITENDIDYHSAGLDSVDGPRDPKILAMIGEIKGVRVLEVAAGDGRYSIPLLENSNQVFAGDKKYSPLLAAQSKLAPDLRRRYHPLRLDAFSRLPLSDQSFDGLVCTGFLYLFPEYMLQSAFGEFARVTRPGAPLLFDFATGIRRERPDGTLVRGPSEVDYTLAQAWATICRVLSSNFLVVRHSVSEIHDELFGSGQPGYTMTNTKINIMAKRV